MGFLERLLYGVGHNDSELARRLDMPIEELRTFQPTYRTFEIPKRSGGRRTIVAPDGPTKALQRRLLRRVLGKLKAHDAAHGFERGKSIVTNASPHVGRAIVMRRDIVDFFQSTSADRVEIYFKSIGWNRKAAALLTRLTTHNQGLPAGAPTSPRLSNLLNAREDAAMVRYVARFDGIYTRYADDITISFPNANQKLRDVQQYLLTIWNIAGYQLHRHKKAYVRRRNKQQIVTGLVVNDKLNVPRERRRWLRAVEHRMKGRDWRSVTPLDSLSSPKQATLTPAELAGWKSYLAMVEQGR